MSNTAQQREVFMEVQVSCFTWVLKSGKKIFFINSSSNITSIGFYPRTYKLSTIILQLNNKKLFDWNIVPRYTIYAGFFYVISISFNVNNPTKNNSFVVVTNKNHLIVSKASFKSCKTQYKPQITKQLIDDCTRKLEELK
jgi:hypothetical protein